MDGSSHCSTMLILWKIWIVHGSTNDFHSISDKKGKGNMLDLFFSTVDGCATRRTTGYKVVYPLGTSMCNIVKKTNGTCEVLCQNFFIGRQQVNLCRTMSRVARFACNQHFSQVRCIHTHACAWSSSMVRRIRIWLVAKEKLRQFGVRKRTRLLPIISETVSPFCWLMTICVGGETGIKAIPSEFSVQKSTVVSQIDWSQMFLYVFINHTDQWETVLLVSISDESESFFVL